MYFLFYKLLGLVKSWNLHWNCRVGDDKITFFKIMLGLLIIHNSHDQYGDVFYCFLLARAIPCSNFNFTLFSNLISRGEFKCLQVSSNIQQFCTMYVMPLHKKGWKFTIIENLGIYTWNIKTGTYHAALFFY